MKFMPLSLRLHGAWLATALALSLPLAAQAEPAYVSDNVNLRAGPSTDYPVVVRLAAGQPLEVVGCTSGYGWCDVVLPDGLRGWVAASLLDYPWGGGTAVPLAQYGAMIGVPIIAFSLGNYWADHYRDRPWYREQRWWGQRRPPPPVAGWRPPPPPSIGWQPRPPRPDWRPPPPRPGWQDRPDRPDRPHPGWQNNRPDRPQPGWQGRPDRPQRPDWNQERPRPQRPEGRPDRHERHDRPDRPDRHDRPDRPDRQQGGGWQGGGRHGGPSLAPGLPRGSVQPSPGQNTPLGDRP
ncbi:SH3 domain-containing protein [Xenophilus arseniciresistens]|uniref:SH3 domain-containing protein n=1 Tax=Xenophilus arseniciresistens TaxID=1283306 RepID=A0AAE3NEZ4_9BURK|nr:SH3 domain-containing protein [Xenophilus arseniciresistens]MDA7418379.1 SH3 domain-containing protein [Xenophilus arseniciresistens]